MTLDSSTRRGGASSPKPKGRARMYPSRIPPDIEKSSLREAERKVYARLRELTEPFVVFYSRPWLGLTSDGREIDGEADFIVAHPDHGVLVIEVKGGGISYNADTGEWTSVDRMRMRNAIRNPVEQAKASKHQLLRKLREHRGLTARFIRAGHAVVFPDAVSPPRDLGADMPRWMFACRDELPELDGWVTDRMTGKFHFTTDDAAAKDTHEPLGNDGIAALVDLIARSFELRAPLADAVNDGEERVLVATREQYDVLDGLEANDRCVIAGAAGTGKTLLAIEKARRLCAGGARTLLTCCSPALASHLRVATAGISGLTVAALADLPEALVCGNAHGAVQVTNFEHPLPLATANLAERLVFAAESVSREQLFDAVVVDEGQDLRPDWWAGLELCMRDSRRGALYVFHDDNQRVYGGHPVWPDDLVRFNLARNLRNTRTIWSQSLPFYTGRKLHAGGRDGRLIEWVALDERDGFERQMSALVARLVGPDELEPTQIAILGRSVPRELQNARLAGIPLCSASEARPGEIVVDTVAGFKGLERPVVIIVRPEQMADDPELMYVGITRARQHLIMLGEQETLEMIRKMAAKPVR